MRLTFSITTLLTLLILAGCDGPTPDSSLNNIYGADDRIRVDVNQAPWNSFGRFASGCTGTVVAPRLVLTAAHCVYDPGRKSLRAGAERFELGRAGGRFESIPLTHVWIGSTDPETDRARDWALARLSKPVDANRVLTLATGTDYSLPMTVTLGGYSDDLASGAYVTAHANCQVLKLGDGGRWLNNCDTGRGISGSPLLRRSGNHFEAVGLAVSEYRDGANESVRAVQYRDEIANVAIGLKAAAWVKAQLEDEFAAGNTTSVISEAFDFSVPGQAQVCVDHRCIVSDVTLRDRAPAIFNKALVMKSIAEDFVFLGEQAENVSLIEEARHLGQTADVMIKVANNLRAPTAGTDAAKSLIQSLNVLEYQTRRVASLTYGIKGQEVGYPGVSRLIREMFDTQAVLAELLTE